MYYRISCFANSCIAEIIKVPLCSLVAGATLPREELLPYLNCGVYPCITVCDVYLVKYSRLLNVGFSLPSSMPCIISTTLSFIGVGTPTLRPNALTTPLMASTSVFLFFSRSCNMLAFSFACLRMAIGMMKNEKAFFNRLL